MEYRIKKWHPDAWPKELGEIPQPPKELYIVGVPPIKENRILAVVGSRAATTYGRDCCEKLIAGLAGYPITIISGMALGMDAVAHEAALKAKLQTVAFPGSGLHPAVLAPRTNHDLAKRILAAGGGLISEFEPTFPAAAWTFPQRNRIVAGIAHATLIIEAKEQSGALITARLALDYNREVLAVPGSIFSDNAKGTNKLLRQGAAPVTKSDDILEALGFNVAAKGSADPSLFDALPDDEKRIMTLLFEPLDRDTLIAKLAKPAHETNVLLSVMEIKGLIKEEYGEIRRS